VAAFSAAVQSDIVIKFGKDERQLNFDVGKGQINFVELVAALVAKPQKAVYMFAAALLLYDQADRIGRALGRMRHAGRQQKYIAFADLHVFKLAVIDQLQNYVAFDLVKKLGRFIVVVIDARIGPADSHNNKIIVGINLLIPHRRAQRVFIVFYPL
jgi:hypothetical protein